MSSAAKAIAEISTYMELVYDADKVIIFCGNIGTHGTSLCKILGEEDCELHERGNLVASIDRFKTGDKKYFLVAGAEYGLDAKDIKLQFVLKFPYPTIDERINTLKRSMGPDFAPWYASEARTRVVQSCGRNVRGFDDFGITVILDSKALDDYTRYKDQYPAWFQARVHDGVF